MRQPADVLKHLAEEAARIGRFDCAAYYARQALAAGVTLAGLASLRYSPPRMVSFGEVVANDHPARAEADSLSTRPIQRSPPQYSYKRA